MTLNEPDFAPPLAPLDRQASLGELAYTSLKESIISGQFVPGRKLTVRSVAQALGVSMPVRDAIVRLIGEGALVNLGPKTVVVPVLTTATPDEVTKIRLALEGLAAFEATAHIEDRDISFLEETQIRINDAMDKAQYADVLRLNKAFHFRLYGTSGMPRDAMQYRERDGQLLLEQKVGSPASAMRAMRFADLLSKVPSRRSAHRA